MHDLKVSHREADVVNDFIFWLQSKYEDNVGKVKGSCGKVRDYLGMEIDFAKTGMGQVKMPKYVEMK